MLRCGSSCYYFYCSSCCLVVAGDLHGVEQSCRTCLMSHIPSLGGWTSTMGVSAQQPCALVHCARVCAGRLVNVCVLVCVCAGICACAGRSSINSAAVCLQRPRSACHVQLWHGRGDRGHQSYFDDVAACSNQHLSRASHVISLGLHFPPLAQSKHSLHIRCCVG